MVAHADSFANERSPPWRFRVPVGQAIGRVRADPAVIDPLRVRPVEAGVGDVEDSESARAQDPGGLIEDGRDVIDVCGDPQDLLGPGNGMCLDLGCGTGLCFDALAATGRTVVGLDRSADQLRIARRRSQQVVPCRRGTNRFSVAARARPGGFPQISAISSAC
jgi:SAM-dependent methyltransferase